MRLADTRRLDARGGLRGASPGGSETLEIQLVSEGGQWRIDNPMNALVVPTSFFDRSFARFNLYFYDQTGRVLLPDPVFIPRGEQTATNLVRGLLAGPGPTLDEISRSALPSRTDLDLSVVVTESGIAEVPLSREVLQASPERAVAGDRPAGLDAAPGAGHRAGPDDAWRARRCRCRGVARRPGDRGIGVRCRWHVGRGAVGTSRGPRRGPLVERRLERSTARSGTPRLLDAQLRGERVAADIAAVSGNGKSVFVSPAEGGADVTSVSRPVVGATDVLRPSYDMFGDLWLIDRTARGARVLVVSGGEVRRLRVPGVTGADVAAFSIARDGSRLAVAYAGTPAPPVRVIAILRTDEGIVSGAGRLPELSPDIADGARIVDIGWRDPATLAVLSRPTAETSEVGFVSSDGSPTLPTLIEPSIFRGAAQAIVVAPDASLPLRLITPDQRLYTLSSDGVWPRTSSKVAAASYAR